MKTISFWLICLSLLGLPLYVVRFKVGPIPTTLLEVLILATVFVWGVEAVLEKTTLQSIWQRVRNPLLPVGVAFVLIALAESFVTTDKLLSLGIWRAYFLEPFIFSLVAVDIGRRTGRGGWFLWSLLGSGLWLCVFTFSQLNWSQLLAYDWKEPWLNSRVEAVFNSPNSLALYLGPLLSLTVVVGTVRRRFLLLIPVLLLALLATKSRGSAIGLVLVAILATASILWSRIRLPVRVWVLRSVAFLGALSVAAVIFFFAALPQLSGYLTTQYPTVAGTTATRFCLWEGARDIILQSPITGSGLRGFQEAYLRVRTCGEDSVYPHNIILNFWVEVGLLGLVAFIFLQTKIFLLLKSSPDRVLVVSLVAAFLYWLGHGLVDVPYFKNDLSVEFWALAALAILVSEGKICMSKVSK